jgi:signal transduction histidine kinase
LFQILPESLYGRLLAILLIGLMVPQLLSALVHLYDRDTLIHQTMGAESAQRIGSIVELLDPMDSVERDKMVTALNGFPLELELNSQYRKEKEPQYRDSSETKKYEGEKVYLLFKEYLQQNLPSGYEVHIEVVEAMLSVEHNSMSSPQQMVKSFHVQVRLNDGVWVNFHYHIPKKIFAWPLRMLVALLLLMVSVLILTWIAVRWVTRPISLLSDAAESLGRDIDHPPLAIEGPKEVKKAVVAFNTMQQRLNRYIGDRSRILSAVSHDLKTPITHLRLRSDLIEDESLRSSIEADLDYMEEMVLSTLDFMRGIENSEPMQQIDLDALLESLQDDLAPLQIKFDIEGQSTQPVIGRISQLKRCLTNLLENGVLHGSGRVWVTIEESKSNLLLSINSEGEKIPAEELERLFEPFYRIEKSRSRLSGGTGLGLSIARDIARAHGGELILYNNPEGGVTAKLELPWYDLPLVS